MDSRHSNYAAKLWTRKRVPETIDERPEPDASHPAFIDEQDDREQVRDVVEDQFIRMNKTHDRIRDEFLGKPIE